MNHAHHFLIPTLDPAFFRCSHGLCGAVGRMPQQRPARPPGGTKPPFAAIGSPTSEEAARAVSEPMRTREQTLVWNAIAGSENGLTDQEISAVTGLPENSVRPRRGELWEDQRIVKAGTRTTRSGRMAQVWKKAGLIA